MYNYELICVAEKGFALRTLFLFDNLAMWTRARSFM